MPLTGLLVDWIWLRKESLSLKISQQKPAKVKSKENKRFKKKKNQNSISKNCGATTKGVTHA